jgi:hypothetical protein
VAEVTLTGETWVWSVGYLVRVRVRVRTCVRGACGSACVRGVLKGRREGKGEEVVGECRAGPARGGVGRSGERRWRKECVRGVQVADVCGSEGAEQCEWK